MPALATVASGAIACSAPGQRRHGQRALQQAAPFRPLPALRPRPSSHWQHVSCAARREEAASTSQQQQGSAAPPAAPAATGAEAEPLGLQHAEQQQEQQHAAAATRWMPASMLSGWQGAGSMLLSLGAVSGAGLLGSGFDISGPFSTLEAVAVLGLTVGIHELGHFLAAVTRGIHVTKFSIGFGPTLFKWQGKEVEYSLRLLPLGGFVAFPDDDPESPYEPDDPDLLKNRSLGDRTAVISAGVLANMALAFAICLVQASTVGIPEPTYLPGVKLGEMRESSVAARSGLRQGYIVLRIGKLEVAPGPGSVNAVVDKIRDSANEELIFTLDRNGERLQVPVTPSQSGDGTGRVGIQLASNSKVLRKKAGDPLMAVKLAAEEVVALTGTVTNGLYQMATNFASTVENVSGPVAILAVGAEVARSNSPGLFQFAALININLAVVNILPLPALDGGYLVFIALEALRGKKLDEGVEKAVQAGGFLILMTAGVSLIVKDTLNLTGLGSMFQ